MFILVFFFFFFSSRRRHTRSLRDWSSDVCSSDLCARARIAAADPGDVRRQRTAAVAAGAIPASRGALHAVDLGTGIWIGGNRRVCALYAIHRTLAGPIAGGRL